MSPHPSGNRLPVPGGDAPGIAVRALRPQELCATSGHMPSGPRLGVPEVRCLCGTKTYRRVVLGGNGAA